MTSKESIKRLESFRDYLCAGNPIWDVNEVAEVFDKAIEGLNAQSAKDINVRSKDTVYRQAAIDAVEFGITYAKAFDTKTGEMTELFKGSNEELRKAVKRLRELPPAPPNVHDLPKDAGCISRQAAIDALWKIKDERDSVYYTSAIHSSIDAIEQLPSAEPERKTGQWILHENQRQEDVDNGNYLYICSECGKSDLHAKTQKVPFCWWCGADMMEVEHE